MSQPPAHAAPQPGHVHLWWWRLPARRADVGARSRWVWAQVRDCLAGYAGCVPEVLAIHRSDNGKPQAPQLPAAFSLAHDDEWALLAVAGSGCIGIDLLGARNLGNPRRLARRIYAAQELALWEALPAAQQQQRLRTRFCAIEAVVKALDWRLWSGLGNVHFLRQGRVARVPLKRAELNLADGEREGCAWALAMDSEILAVEHRCL